MTTKHIVELTILAAMLSPLAVLYGGRWFDNWLDRRLTFELPAADVEHLPIYEESLAAIRERGAMVAADDSWLRGAS